MKSGPNWPSGLGGNVNCLQMPDARELAYQNSSPSTLCSGELIIN